MPAYSMDMHVAVCVFALLFTGSRDLKPIHESTGYGEETKNKLTMPVKKKMEPIRGHFDFKAMNLILKTTVAFLLLKQKSKNTFKSSLLLQ